MSKFQRRSSVLYGKGILSAPPSPLSPAEFDAQLHFADKAPNSRRAIVSPAKRSEPEERKAESPASSLVQPPNPNVPDSASGQSSADDARSTSGEAPVSETSAAPSMLYSVPCTLHLTAAAIQTSEDDLLADLNKVSRVLDLFLNNQISEAQALCYEPAKAGSLYMSHGFSTISTLKALLSFEQEDLANAIECCQSTIHLCNLLRKPTAVQHTLGNWIRGSASGDQMRGMSTIQRHAELISAECSMLKAFSSIMRSGDFFTFIREALSFRSAYSTYKALGKYAESAKAAGQPIDEAFQSGVSLGLGAISLVLSLLPEKAVSIMGYFGFEGDKQLGVDLLKQPGGWGQTPPIPRDLQGLRRPLADMTLLAYILYISTLVPTGRIDTALAARVLEFNQDLYSNGSFFLLFQGRLKTIQTLEEEAVKYYWKSINSQQEAVQLHHICHWDLGIIYMAMGDMSAAHSSFSIIYQSSNWSKAVYAYAAAASLYDEAVQSNPIDSTKREQAAKLMREVPGHKKRIAGKSIPMEKYVIRRAKRFCDQGDKLVLASTELTFMLNALQYASRSTLRNVHLKHSNTVLRSLQAIPDSQRDEWNDNGTYWDDWCLCKLISGACHRLIAYPEDHVLHDDSPFGDADEERHGESSFGDLSEVITHGRKIRLEHHIVWYAHYELGRLHESRGNMDEAARQYNLVVTNPKQMDVASSEGKVSLQQAVVIRANAALSMLEQARKGATA